MKQVLSIAALAALCATTGLALAQQKPEDAIKFRKGAYQVIGYYTGQMGAMVKGQRPFDQKTFVRNSGIVETMSQVVPDAFPAGSDKGDTRAKPEIWQDQDKFKSALERFQAEAAKMSEVSKQGNADQIKNQFGALAKACSNCHDNFRTK
jgi:cytochrome c556